MTRKISTAEDLQGELRAILAMTEEEVPSRSKLALALSDLAERVSKSRPNLMQSLVLRDLSGDLKAIVNKASDITDSIEDWAALHTSVPRSKAELAEVNGMVRKLKYSAKLMLEILDYTNEDLSSKGIAEYFGTFTPNGNGDYVLKQTQPKFEKALKELHQLTDVILSLRKKWFYLWVEDDSPSDRIISEVGGLASDMAACSMMYRQFREPMLEVLMVAQDLQRNHR